MKKLLLLLSLSLLFFGKNHLNNNEVNAQVKPTCEAAYKYTESIFNNIFMSKAIPNYDPDFIKLACVKDEVDITRYIIKLNGLDAVVSAALKFVTSESNLVKKASESFSDGNDSCKTGYNFVATTNPILKQSVSYEIWQYFNCEKNPTDGVMNTKKDTQANLDQSQINQAGAINENAKVNLARSAVACDSFTDLSFPCLVQWIIGLLFTPINAILVLCAQIFDSILALTLSSTVYNNLSGFIAGFWALLRDMSNIVFLLLLLYIGVMTILGREKNYKPQIAGIIVSALLVNFSLFYAKVIVDIGNISARIFYKNLDTNVVKTSNTTGELQVKGISEAVANKIQPQKIIASFHQQDELSEFGIAVDIFITYLLFGLVSLVMIKIFLSLAIIFLVRTISLWLLMATSAIPILFKFIETKELQAKIKNSSEFVDFDSWHSQIWSASFMPAVFCMFMYFILTLINADIFNYEAAAGNALSALIPVITMLGIIYILLNQAEKYSQKLAGNISNIVTSKIQGGVNMIAGAALGAATGGAAMLTRSTLGRGAEWAANAARKGLGSDNRATRMFSRVASNSLDRVAKNSFDVRDIKLGKLGTLGSVVKDKTKIDMESTLPGMAGTKKFLDMGRKGGIKAQRDEMQKLKDEKDKERLAYLAVRADEPMQQDVNKAKAEKERLEKEAQVLAGGEENRKKYDEAVKNKKDAEKAAKEIQKDIEEKEKELNAETDPKKRKDIEEKIKNRKNNLDSEEVKIKNANKVMSDIEGKADTLSDKIKGKSEADAEREAINEAKEKQAHVFKSTEEAVSENKKHTDNLKKTENEIQNLENELKKLDADLKSGTLSKPEYDKSKKETNTKLTNAKTQKKKHEILLKDASAKLKKLQDFKNKIYNNDGTIKEDAIKDSLYKKKGDSTAENAKLTKFKEQLEIKNKTDLEKIKAEEDKLKRYEGDTTPAGITAKNAIEMRISAMKIAIDDENIILNDNIKKIESDIEEIEREGLISLMQNKKTIEAEILKAQLAGNSTLESELETKKKLIDTNISNINKDFSNFEKRNKDLSSKIKGADTVQKEAEKVVKEATKKRFGHYADFVEKYEASVDNGIAIGLAMAVGAATGGVGAFAFGSGSLLGGALVSGGIEAGTRLAATAKWRQSYNATVQAGAMRDGRAVDRAKAIRDKAK